LRFFFLRDRTFLRELGLQPGSEFESARSRYALDVQQTQELPFGITQKLRILESSDNRYPIFIGDIPGRGEAVLTSDLIFSRHTDDFSAYIAGRRFRNLLNFTGSDSAEERAKAAVRFDPSTVQQFPTAVLTTRDRFLFGSKVAGGLTFGFSNFSRATDAFDRLPSLSEPDRPADASRPPVPGVDPIRRATRFSLTPSLYTTLRPLDAVSLVPSLEYRGFFYSFGQVVPNLTRGYLQLRADLSAQLERIYQTASPTRPRLKHVIRPLLSYSLIPLVNEDSRHPFLSQIQFARDNAITGLNFDNSDIVPLDSSLSASNYFIPLGNSLTYGLTTQLIRRMGEDGREDAFYRRDVEFRLGQSYNFRENRPEAAGQPFSRLFASLVSQGDRLTTSTDYFYYPYLTLGRPRSTVSTSATYVLRRGITRRIYDFDRSVSLGYVYNFTNQSATSNLRASLAYSLSDFVLPSGYVSYDFVTSQIIDTGVALRFQSPAQCWRVDIGVRQFKCAGVTDSGVCTNPTIDFMLNLAGGGFSGVSPAGQ
jgi:hypothetical protein